MRLQVTQTDSNDEPTTSEVTGYFEGERYAVMVHSTGTTEQMPEALAEHLRETTTLEPYEGDTVSETEAEETETASSDESAEDGDGGESTSNETETDTE